MDMAGKPAGKFVAAVDIYVSLNSDLLDGPLLALAPRALRDVRIFSARCFGV